ncbi:MAG: hypothetical protein GX573_23780 [Chloroflexi bacterium]|nr:hypothetical protein [Chloroflexota bacterium]
MPEPTNAPHLTDVDEYLGLCIWAALQHRDDPERMARMLRAAAKVRAQYIRLRDAFGDDARSGA